MQCNVVFITVNHHHITDHQLHHKHHHKDKIWQKSLLFQMVNRKHKSSTCAPCSQKTCFLITGLHFVPGLLSSLCIFSDSLIVCCSNNAFQSCQNSLRLIRCKNYEKQFPEQSCVYSPGCPGQCSHTWQRRTERPPPTPSCPNTHTI